jgi:hypothetical protein
MENEITLALHTHTSLFGDTVDTISIELTLLHMRIKVTLNQGLLLLVSAQLSRDNI